MNIKINIRLLCLAFLSSIFSIHFCCAQVLIDKSLNKSISVHHHSKIFDALNQDYSIDEIFKNQQNFKFKSIENERENLGFTTHYFWIKFEITNTTSNPQSYLFETARPIIDSVILYTFKNGNLFSTQMSGDAIEFKERAVKHRKSLFHILLLPNETQEFFIKIKSDGESLMLPLQLHPQNSILESTFKEQIVYGVFYGILILACIIYLFFYFALRDKTFLYYALYVLFIGLLQFALDGFFYQYVIPSSGWLYNRSVLLIALIAAYFLGKYGSTYLNVQQNFKILNRFFLIQYIAIGIVFIGLLTIPSFLPLGYPIANALGFLVLISIIISILANYKKRIKVDWFFIAGIAFLVMGFVIFILNNFNTISNSFLSENAPKFGTGLEVIFLSISMSNRIKMLRLENEANQELAFQREKDMNDIKSLFLSNLSHELRTPLNLIMGATSSLYAMANNEELKYKYDLILNSSKSLLKSIDDVLNFTVIEKAGHLLKNQSFDLHEIMERQSSIFKFIAEEKGLIFNTEIDANLPKYVVGDKEKLQQIISNLLDNAVKFTPKGNVDFTISSNKLSQNKVSIEILIKDSGIGISKEKMKTVFESFTKREFNDNREFDGMGLGLYIAKTFVNLKGGNINIENLENGGVACKVHLDYDLAEMEFAADNIISDFSVLMDNLKLNILLVEDNQMNQMVIQLIFNKYKNINIDIANNGKEGVELHLKNKYDLVFMDLQMPVMDGFEAIAAIRSSDFNFNVPILVITADVTDKTKKLVFDLGANDYLTKPINNELLFSKIIGLISDLKLK